MNYPLYSDQDYADFFNVIREINKSLHHIKEYNQIERIKKRFEEAKKAMKVMAIQFDGLIKAIKREGHGEIEEEKGIDIIIEVLIHLRRSVSIEEKFGGFLKKLNKIQPRVLISEDDSDLIDIPSDPEELENKLPAAIQPNWQKLNDNEQVEFTSEYKNKKLSLDYLEQILDPDFRERRQKVYKQKKDQIIFRRSDIDPKKEKDYGNQIWKEFVNINESRNNARKQINIIFQKIIELQEVSREYLNFYKNRIEELNALFNDKYINVDESSDEIKTLFGDFFDMLSVLEDPQNKLKNIDHELTEEKVKDKFLKSYRDFIKYVENIRESLNDLIIERNRFRGLSLYYTPHKTELLKKRNPEIKKEQEKNSIDLDTITIKIYNVWRDIKDMYFLKEVDTKILKDEVRETFNEYWLKDQSEQLEKDQKENEGISALEEIVLRRALIILARLDEERIKQYFEFFIKSGKIKNWTEFTEQIKIIEVVDRHEYVLNIDKRKISDTNWQLNVYLEKLWFEQFLIQLADVPFNVVWKNEKLVKFLGRKEGIVPGNNVEELTSDLEKILTSGKIEFITALKKALDSIVQKDFGYFIPEVDYFLNCSKDHFKDASSRAFSDSPTDYQPKKIKNKVLRDSLQKRGLKISRRYRKVFEVIDQKIFANEQLGKFFWYFRKGGRSEKLADTTVVNLLGISKTIKDSHRELINKLKVISINNRKTKAEFLELIGEKITEIAKKIKDIEQKIITRIDDEGKEESHETVEIYKNLNNDLVAEQKGLKNRFKVLKDIAEKEDVTKATIEKKLSANKKQLTDNLVKIIETIRTQIKNPNRDYQSMVDEVISRLEEIKVRRYNILNEILHSSQFTQINDKLQIYGGALGIWNQEAQKLVRIQDRRFTPKDYRPYSSYNDQWYLDQGLGNKWFDLPERTIVNDRWESHPYKESVDLLFLSEEKQMLRPKFYKNFSEDENSLIDIEKDNQFLFCEDGEIGAIILLYRFMDGLFNTRTKKFLQNGRAEYFFEQEKQINAKEKEFLDDLKLSSTQRKILLDILREVGAEFFAPGLNPQKRNIGISKIEKIIIEDGEDEKWNQLSQKQKSLVEYKVAIKYIDYYYSRFSKELQDEPEFSFLDKEPEYLSDYQIRIIQMYFAFDDFKKRLEEKERQILEEIKLISNEVNSLGEENKQLAAEQLDEKIRKKNAAIEELREFTKDNLSKRCLHLLLRAVFNSDSFLKLNFARQTISENLKENAFDKYEARIRQEKIQRTFDRRLEIGATIFARELHTQGLIGNERELAERDPKIKIDDEEYRTLVLDEYQDHYTITERYTNLCEFIEKELNPVKKRLKIRANFNGYVDKINPENYLVDKRLNKLDLENKQLEKERREKYLSEIRQNIISVVREGSNNRKIEKSTVKKQLVSIVSLLLESLHPFLGGKAIDSKEFVFINKLNNPKKEENHRSNLWILVKEHLDRMARFPLSQYFVWRSNRLYAHSSLTFPIASTTTNKDASKVGFLILGFRNIIDKESGKTIHLTHDTENALKEFIFTVRSIYQPLAHPLMDHIYYNQIVNKSVQDNAIRAAVARVMARNLSHNIGSHVLGKISDPETFQGSLSDVKDSKNSISNDSLLANLNAYLRERMDLIADISTTTPNYVSTKLLSKIISKLDSKNADSQKILLTYISGIQNKTSKNIQVSYYDEEKELYASIPHDLLGFQAFYVIIENIIRNTFKHNDFSKYDNFKCVQIKVYPKVMDKEWGGNFIKVNIEVIFLDKNDARIPVDLTHQDKDLDEHLREIFNMSILDPNTKQLRINNWGLLEIKIAATYLRRISLSEIDKENLHGPPIVNVDINEEGNLSYTIFLERPLEILFVHDPKYDSHITPAVKSKIEQLKFKGIEIISASSKRAKKLEEQFKRDRFIETDYNFFISDFKDYRFSPVQRILKLKDFFKFVTAKDRKFDEIMAEVWMEWIESNIKAKNNKLKYSTDSIFLLDQDSKFRKINKRTISKKKDSKETEQAVPRKHDQRPLIHLKEKKEQREESFIFIESHWNNIDTVYNWKYPEHGKEEKLIYYHSYRSINYVLKEQVRELDINESEKKSLQILGKLLEGAQTGVAILDERVQYTAKDNSNITLQNGNPISRHQILEMAGIYSPIINGKGALNLQGDESYDSQDIYKWVKELKKKRNVSFLIVHVGVAEKAFDSTKESDMEKLMKNINELDIQLVFVSGRGKPANLPDMAYFLNSSILMSYLFTPLDKFKLTQVLYSLRRVPKNKY